MNISREGFGNQSPTNWQEMTKVLKAAQVEYRDFEPIMTHLEQIIIQKDIKARCDQYRSAIEKGVIGDHTAAINHLKDSLANVEGEKRKITNSWDAGKLAAEMQVYQMRMDKAAETGNLAGLRAIYAEAVDSGDRTKQRAAAEVLQGATAKVPKAAQDSHGTPAVRQVNLLEKQAARDLAALNTSPALEAAHKAASEAVEGLNAAKEQIYKAAEAMGDVWPLPGGSIHNSNLIRAIERINLDGEGNFIFKE